MSGLGQTDYLDRDDYQDYNDYDGDGDDGDDGEEGKSFKKKETELMGHSCNIGNAPNLVGKKLKTVICVF